MASDRDQDMYGSMPLRSLFVKCSVPAILSSFMWAVCSITDGIFIGNQLGGTALAAINVAWPLAMLPPAIAKMIGVGALVRISMCLGNKDDHTARVIYTNATMGLLLVSVVVAVLFTVFAYPMAELMGAEGEIALGAAQYTQVCAVFAPAMLLFLAANYYLVACGQVRFSMYINVGVAVSNILLDALFLVGFGWGLWSAAFATALSTTWGAAVVMMPMLRKKLVLYFVRGRMSPKVWRNILYNGSSDFFNNLSGCIFMIVGNAVLFRVSGSMSVTVFGIMMYINSVMMSFVIGMCNGMNSPLSYNHGAGNGVRVKGMMRLLLSFGLLSGVLIALFVYTCDGMLVYLFVGNDPAVAAASEHGLHIYAASFLFSWVVTITVAALTSLNRPRESLILGVLSQCVFPVGLMLMLCGYGEDGVWWAFSMGAMLSAISAAVLLLRLRSNGTYRMHDPVLTEL